MLSFIKSRRFGIMFSYIAREYLLSFFVSFLFFFSLFFINQLLVIARDVLSKQVDIVSTLLLIVYALPAIVALAFPFASLVGALMAVGRFSTDNEMTAMQACGFSLIYIFLPILLLAFVIALVSFVMNDIFLPLGTIEYVKLYQNLVFSNTELILQPYAVTKYKNASLITGNVKSGKIDQILIMDTDERGQQRVISANAGILSKNDKQAGIITLDLQKVFIFDLVLGTSSYNFSLADQIRYNMLLQNFSVDMRNPSPREMSSADIYDRIAEMRKEFERTQKELGLANTFQRWRFLSEYEAQGISNPDFSKSGSEKYLLLAPGLEPLKVFLDAPKTDRNLQLYWIEYWKKYSIPAACFTLIFLGFPAGMFAKRSGRSIGFGIGFIIAVIFWFMLIIGQSVGVENLSLSPFLLMWAPNILFFSIGVFMFIRRMVR